MASVLIAGCGYVGSALATRLGDGGHLVYALRRRPVPGAHGFQPIAADLTDPGSLTDVLPAVDYVFYLVGADASTEDAYRRAYIDGLRNLLATLPHDGSAPRRLFLASSTAVYAQAGGEWVDESSPTCPERFQGRVLLDSEAIARRAPLASTVVRFGGIYGPGRTRTIDALRAGSLQVARAPQLTNRIHRDDCAGFLAHLIEVHEPEPLYVAVDDEPADRRSVLEWLASRLGTAPPPVDRDAPPAARGKRCSNELMRAAGYRLIYPTFRDGYGAMLAEEAC